MTRLVAVTTHPKGLISLASPLGPRSAQVLAGAVAAYCEAACMRILRALRDLWYNREG